MLFLALNAAGIIRQKLVPAGAILIRLYYLVLMKSLYTRMLSVRIELLRKKCLLLFM
jgi:hypothetical protein